MSTNLAVMDSRYGFTSEQVDVIKATIAPGATNEELALFLMVCQKTGLDPFSRQIYLSERRSFDKDKQQWVVKKTPETTIDGFRVIAERSREYEGQLGPFWCGDDGDWKDVWLPRDKMPTAAKVGVLRKGFREPMWAVALFEEYVQTTKEGKPNQMWSKMGANQLAKCCESLALRKAFPRDLSGMYSKEEMEQSRKAKEDRDDEASEKAQNEVAQRRIKELSAPRVTEDGISTERSLEEIAHARADKYTSPSTIIELADSLDAPPEPPLMAYEEGTTAKQQEAAAALKPVGTPKETRKRGAISFAALKPWGEIKKEILALTGTTDLYYEALKAGGYEHADEIKTKEDAAKIWKALKAITAELARSKQDKALMLEVETHALRIGGMATQAALERRGLRSIEDVLTMQDSVELDALLTELRTTA